MVIPRSTASLLEIGNDGTVVRAIVRPLNLAKDRAASKLLRDEIKPDGAAVAYFQLRRLRWCPSSVAVNPDSEYFIATRFFDHVIR